MTHISQEMSNDIERDIRARVANSVAVSKGCIECPWCGDLQGGPFINRDRVCCTRCSRIYLQRVTFLCFTQKVSDR